jgi:hypothetical protein
MWMVAILALLCVFGVSLFLEFYAKSRPLRVIGVFWLMLVCTGIALNVGMTLGKSQQLNRFAFMLPDALTRLDEVKHEPERFNARMRLLKDTARDSQKLDTFETTLNELNQK